MINAIVTAYCAGIICANGHKPIEGVTIAAPRNIPFGTVVVIDDHKYIVQDRTNKRFNGRWDIYMKSREQCIKFGKQNKNIT